MSIRTKRPLVGLGIVALAALVGLGPAVAASAHSSHHSKKHHKSKSKSSATSKSSSKAASRTVTTTCPTAAQLSAAAGSSYPAPKVDKTATTVVCDYNTTTSGANLVLGFSSAEGTTPADLKLSTASQAKAQGAASVALSGYGTAAFIDTLDDATSNPDNEPTTQFQALDGSELITIAADATQTSVEAVAHYVLTR